MPDSSLARLRNLDACALSDAIDKLRPSGITSSVVTGVPLRSGAGRIAGRAITVLLGVGETQSGPVRHLGTTAVELAGPDNVIVVEQRTGIDAGCWGGLLTLAAKLRNVVGVIADGPVRDIDEANDLAFPIFASATTARTARGRIVEKATNTPIIVWDARVEPGDYVLADRSAIVFVREAEIVKILDAAEAIAARELSMATALREGAAVTAVMGGDYESMLKS